MKNETKARPWVIVVPGRGGEARRREAAVYIAAALLEKLNEEKSLQNRLQTEKNCDTISI